MPYRLDLRNPPNDAFDRLVQLGALDVEAIDDGLAALLPDRVAVDMLADVLGLDAATLDVSTARGRDDGSVWTLTHRTTLAGRLQILPAQLPATPGSVRLIDGDAFGTGLHATTALCLEALQDVLDAEVPGRMLDVGTGSGILALAALVLGVPHALGLDISVDALSEAARNAQLNGVADRLALVCGGPDAIDGRWSLVVANVVAAPLMEMAPVLVHRVDHAGTLVLSGIPVSVAGEVERIYRRLGMWHVSTEARAGWVMQLFRASW